MSTKDTKSLAQKLSIICSVFALLAGEAFASDGGSRKRWFPAAQCKGTIASLHFSDRYIRLWLDWIYHQTSQQGCNFIEFGAATGPVMVNAVEHFLWAIESFVADATPSAAFNPSRFYAVDLDQNQLDELKDSVEERFGKPAQRDHLTVVQGILPSHFLYPEGVTFDGAATFRMLHFLNEDETMAFLIDLHSRLNRGAPVVATVESLYLPIVSESSREAHLKRDRDEGIPRPFVLETLPAEYTKQTGSQGRRFFHSVESLSHAFRKAGYEVLYCGYISDRSETFPDSLVHQDPALLKYNRKLSIGIVARRRSISTRLRRVHQDDLMDLIEEKLVTVAPRG